MATLQALPENARFYIEKNFYNDANGNPRIYFEIYDENMEFLGFCQDNYAGTNFTYGRDIKRVSYQKASGIRQYKQSLKGCIEFKNESVKSLVNKSYKVLVLFNLIQELCLNNIRQWNTHLYYYGTMIQGMTT